MNIKIKDNSKVIISAAIGVLAFLAWLKLLDMNLVIEEFKTISIFPVIIGAFFYLFSFILKSLRWQRIVAPIKKVNFKILFKIYMVNIYLNLVSPVKLGEIVQGLLLKKIEKIPFSAGLPTIIIDKMLSFTATLLLFIIAFPFLEFQLHVYLRWALLAVSFGFLIAIVFLFLERDKKTKILKLATRLFFFLSESFKEKLHSFIDGFADSFEIVKKQWKNMPFFLLISFMILFAEGLTLYFMAKSCPLEIPILVCVIGVTMFNLFYLFPTPPVSIGTTQWYYSLIFIFGFGMHKEKMAVIILLMHLVHVIVILIAGLFSFVTLGVDMMQLKEEIKKT